MASSRSALPDTSSHSYRHVLFAPKHEPTAAPSKPVLSLPSTSVIPSLTLNSSALSSTSTRFGPQKQSGYARAISRIDYQPDICKDWMECGSCGYGDSCKFLHDRLDYKAGWQVELDWEAQQKKAEAKQREDRERRERGETVVDPSSKARVQLPFACYLCRRPFTNPVVTACGHYFDERCALTRFAKTSRCAVCGKETHGSFTQATELLRELNKEKAGKGKPVAEEDEVDDGDVSDGAQRCAINCGFPSISRHRGVV